MTMSEKLLFSFQAGIGSVLNDLIWYSFAAGLLSLLFQLVLRRAMAPRKIIQRFAPLNQIAFNVFGHCGYEIFPRWFLNSWAGKLLNTPTHHALHHEKIRGNYGLYFNIWDRLMNTNHPDYQSRFEKTTSAGAL